MKTMTLAQFLRARYNERMAALRRLEAGHCQGFEMSVPGGAVAFSTRVEMAEIAAKRAIVAHETRGHRVRRGGPNLVHASDGIYRDPDLHDRLTPDEVAAWQHEWTEPITDTPVLRLLALPYVGHQDYTPDWRADHPSRT